MLTAIFTTLQSFWRGVAVRRTLLLRRVAAIKLQVVGDCIQPRISTSHLAWPLQFVPPHLQR